MKITTESFGQLLQQLRRASGISQRALAEKVGVDFSYISKVENDRLPPPAADTIVKICAVLQTPPDKLLALTGKMPTDLKTAVSSNPAALEFIREASEMGLTTDEWKHLTKRLKKLRS